VKLSETSIKRPVLATVMSLAIILLGVISYGRLAVREYPDVDPPIVSVTTLYRGASPSVVETEITDVLEEQFATLEDVKTMTSSSREQGSTITIEFELGRDVDQAANDVRDRVSRIRGSLPREADDPVIAKVDVDAQPIMWISLSSERHTTLELSDLAERVLKDRLQRLPGVGNIFIGGERRYAMRVWLDPQRMAARDITTQDVEAAINLANAEIPGGRVEGEEREFSVRTMGELQRPEEFARIVVRREGDEVVRLADIATVEVGAEDERTVTRFNGRPAIGLGIVKQKNASTVSVAQAVRAALPRLDDALEAGMRLDIAYDSAIFIEDSIHEVRNTFLIALGLVILTVLLFLKSFRAMLIPIVAIPVAIVGTFTVAYALDFSINIITLLALVLAIGLVVDDAIVVLENIFRHREMGRTRRQAAFAGMQEIGFAVVATTIALVSVFLPVAFLTGTIGRLFREFGISLAVAVLISSFVALTLTPVLCSLMLGEVRRRTATNWRERSFEAFFDGLNRSYAATLRFVMARPVLVAVVVVVTLGVTVWFYRSLPRELVPTEDRGAAFGIVQAPEGATLEYTDRYMRQVESILLPVPERQALFSAVGLGFGGPGRVTDGFLFLRLVPRDQRDRSQQAIVQSLFPRLLAIPGVMAFIINPPSLGGRGSTSPVEYVLQGDDYQTLGQAVQAFMGEASQLGYLVNLDSDLRLNKPQLEIRIDRERAAQLGVSVTDIGTTLETFLGGRVASQFKRGTKQYDVITQVRPTDRARPDVIRNLYLRGRDGLVQLANVVTIDETVAPKELNHYNRVRSATITANLAPGYALGEALDDLDAIADRTLPAGMRTELAGQSLEFRQSSGSLTFMFGLAVAFIFLVLAAQFESFVHPLTILLSVPLAVVGAIVSLFLLGQSLNIFSQIGLVMLVGLVTKNAILIVEFANQLRNRGKATTDAVIEASVIRLRPILMTSLSTVFGILPIAIGFGAGAESRRPLGIAVVGGVLFSTFLTLVLVPVVYRVLARFTEARREAEIEADLEAAQLPPPEPEAAAATAATES